MITYKFVKSEPYQADKIIEISDAQVNVLLSALSRYIDDYENMDSDYLSDEDKVELIEAHHLDGLFGSLFV